MMAKSQDKPTGFDLRVEARPLTKNEGAMVFILREGGGAEVHFPQLGRISEGQLERYQMLMYRGLLQARSAEARKDLTP